MKIKNSSVQSLLKEVSSLTDQGQWQSQISDIVNLINKCIFYLDSADVYMKQYSDINNKQTALMSMKMAQLQDKENKYSDALKNELNDITVERLQQQTYEALAKGYALVTKLAELVTNRPLTYTVVVAGSNGKSSTLASSTLTLEESLSDAVLDFETQGIGLSIRSTQKTINNALNKLTDKGTVGNRFKKNVFQKLKIMKLSDQQKKVWDDLKAVGDAAIIESEDKNKHKTKYGINYGTVTESFMDFYRKGYNIMSGDYSRIHFSYYNMLEKGRNNLTYYKDGDVVYHDSQNKLIHEQIKSLTSFTSTARFDVATLSNVSTPLADLKKIFEAYQEKPDNNVLMQALNKEFTAEEGEGDRKWKGAVSMEVHKFLDDTFGTKYYT